MSCRVVAKRRQKKGEKSAFVCVLRRFSDWTGKHTASTSNAAYKRKNPHSSTLITTVISPICPSPALQKKTEINSDRLWKRATLWCAGSPSHRNVAFSISRGRFGSDQPLFDQAAYIFLDSVFSHADSVTDCFAIRMALKGFSVFAAEQICIDSNLTAAQSQTKYFIRHGEIIL